MRSAVRLLLLIGLSLLSLQLFFGARIAMMVWVDPQSTAFQRSEIWQLLTRRGEVAWAQQWVPAARISDHLKRAVIASEDAGFTDHDGVEWEAIERAWERNQKAQERAERLNQRAERRAGASATPPRKVEAKVRGGSTITQQLAKNLFMGSERNYARKGQEFVVTFMLEALLSKQRILEIYLNNVEWGEGVFGAEAAAQHHFRVPAAGLSTYQAARLAVMLPAPKKPGFGQGHVGTIQARMGAVDLP